MGTAYTTVIEYVNTPSQSRISTRKWECNYCKKVFTSTSTHVKEHLSGLGGRLGACKKVPPEVAAAINKANPNIASRAASKKNKNARVINEQQLVDEFEDSCEPQLQGGSASSIGGGPPMKRSRAGQDDDAGTTFAGNSCLQVESKQSTLQDALIRIHG